MSKQALSNFIFKQTSLYTKLFLGPLLFGLTYFTDPMWGFSDNGWLVLGIILWMAVWWVTEIVPIPVTAILPIVVIPLFGISSISEATIGYSNPLIYLFLGGFLISIAMEKWNLHKRIALVTLIFSGKKPSQQLAGLMIVTAFLSMWMSNTATAVMMLPIALSIISLRNGKEEGKRSQFGVSLLLAIAYSASIGGVATLIGSPPNALFAGYVLSTYDITVGFSEWMMVGLPLSIVMLVIAWFLLSKVLFKVDGNGAIPIVKDKLREELKKLGRVTSPEKVVMVVFALAAFLWITRPIIESLLNIPLNDTIIALACASLLFIIPINSISKKRVLEWGDTKNLPWGVLLLFGGGLTLADQIQKTGIAELIADQIATVDLGSVILLTIMIVTIVVFLTEVTSNTATAAGFLPLLGPVALSFGGSLAPILVPAVLATSYAFMMPVATPPNSIVFASGELKIKDMIRAGFVLNLVAIGLITLFAAFVIPVVFNF